MGSVKIYRSIAKLENIDIFYRDTKTEGPAILCLHGRWGRGETWVDFIRHYGEKYWAIAPDQREHDIRRKEQPSWPPKPEGKHERVKGT